MIKLSECCNGDVRKPLYFIELYDQYLLGRRNDVRMVLEIGVQSGGCLEMWKNYFPNAEIHGIDIDPIPYRDRGARTHLHLGDQADVAFLESVVKESGHPDFVVDDGGHLMNQQITSFNTLFPLLNPGGIYAIEDLFSSYNKDMTPVEELTTIEYLKQLVDPLSYGYVHLEYGPGEKPAHMHIKSIHFYDCIAFILKDNHA